MLPQVWKLSCSFENVINKDSLGIVVNLLLEAAAQKGVQWKIGVYRGLTQLIKSLLQSVPNLVHHDASPSGVHDASEDMVFHNANRPQAEIRLQISVV